jgi:acyl-CoA dehydrogenase
MSDASYRTWPFFDDAHRRLAESVDAWSDEHLRSVESVTAATVHATCRRFVALFGRSGWLCYCVPKEFGGAAERIDTRSICLIREAFARRDALAEFAFAMQGLGSHPISIHGSDEVKSRYLPRVVTGDAIAAFAISERDAGTDVGAIATKARREGDRYIIDGEKTWISNGGIADFYVVFARTGEAPGNKGLSAFAVDATAPGLRVAERIDVIAPHPLATLRFESCSVPASDMLGKPGEGFAIAMRTLDAFRPTVAAAALGMARRALDEAIDHASQREMFGAKLIDLQLTQAAVADMATGVDTSALLTYRAAWTRDVLGQAGTRESAMAKFTATETAQAVIDRALQLFGGLGLVSGHIVERLYREIRALRIYEGATEVQKLVVARETLREARGVAAKPAPVGR